VWPGTKEWVWEKGWLREFLRLLEEATGRITTSTFGEYLRTHRATGRVYLPTASYEEMGEWALPASTQATYNEVRRTLESRGELERARPFIRGGIWQAFLAKYPESNFMHKKMILVSDKLARAEEKLGDEGRAALDHARHELYRAQCNCCYWHGLFGGLYLNYLRDAVYHHLIEAELQAERVLGELKESRQADLDADLQPEVLLSNAEAAVYLKPDRGGSLFELDYRPKRFNLLNIVGRREEGYHKRLLEATRQLGQHGGGPVSIHDLTALKSAGLEDLLVYDRFPRGVFVDHFLAEDTSLEGLARGRFDERGDFADGIYRVVELKGRRVVLARAGHVDGRPLTVEKTIALADLDQADESARLECRYRLAVEGAPLTVTFAPEVALTLLAGDAPDRYYRVPGRELTDRRLASRGESEAGQPIELVNEWDRFLVRLSASPDAPWWRYPLETASQSEGGFERTYQASVLHPIWRRLTVEPGRPLELTITVEMKSF
jgi:alpha-amylase